MSNDLISREALKEEVNNRFDNSAYFPFRFLELIDNAPTVDLTKNQAYDKGFITAMKLYARPQGEWIKNTDTVFKNRFNCSICGKLIFEPKEENNYCSKCGADMRGVKE